MAIHFIIPVNVKEYLSELVKNGTARADWFNKLEEKFPGESEKLNKSELSYLITNFTTTRVKEGQTWQCVRSEQRDVAAIPSTVTPTICVESQGVEERLTVQRMEAFLQNYESRHAEDSLKIQRMENMIHAMLTGIVHNTQSITELTGLLTGGQLIRCHAVLVLPL